MLKALFSKQSSSDSRVESRQRSSKRKGSGAKSPLSAEVTDGYAASSPKTTPSNSRSTVGTYRTAPTGSRSSNATYAPVMQRPVPTVRLVPPQPLPKFDLPTSMPPALWLVKARVTAHQAVEMIEPFMLVPRNLPYSLESILAHANPRCQKAFIDYVAKYFARPDSRWEAMDLIDAALQAKDASR